MFLSGNARALACEWMRWTVAGFFLLSRNVRYPQPADDGRSRIFYGPPPPIPGQHGKPERQTQGYLSTQHYTTHVIEEWNEYREVIDVRMGPHGGCQTRHVNVGA